MLTKREKNLIKSGYLAGFKAGFSKGNCRAFLHFSYFEYEEVYKSFEKWLAKVKNNNWRENHEK